MYVPCHSSQHVHTPTYTYAPHVCVTHMCMHAVWHDLSLAKCIKLLLVQRDDCIGSKCQMTLLKLATWCPIIWGVCGLVHRCLDIVFHSALCLHEAQLPCQALYM